ncbi:hypothetical protein FGG08_003242 [Glutinoglossum americanum]|uniref:Aldose 1-epimerase n=1 Tax=Glutinoglossum americanum TaxID=1670608 RepID=A0A9P8IDQ6_9PEZI|nr:hypothetical protein FGG08_003242 [Glutinoglossum americanum]
MPTTGNEPIFSFIQQGAIIKEFVIAGRNIVLGFPDDQAYQTHNTAYFGETIGRVANRVRDATIQNLNGRSCHLAANNGPNSAHGGSVGWGKKMFQGPNLEMRDGKETAVFRLRAEHGDEGYPGTVDFSVAYTASTEVEAGLEKALLIIDYEVKLADEQPEGIEETAINITNHRHVLPQKKPPPSTKLTSRHCTSYFNIGPGETITGTKATLRTDLHLPTDENGIPIGNIEPCPGVKANEAFTLDEGESDFDDCFILNDHPATVPLDTRPLPLRTAALFGHAETGMHLEVLTTEPAFQFYTGKYIDVPAVGGAPTRKAYAGFCVEPSRYINAVNVDEWRNMTVLRLGEVYGSRIGYKAWKDSGNSNS